MDKETPALNPALDWSALAAVFARTGRVHIPDVLTRESALRTYRCLTEETPWSLVVYKDGKRSDIPGLSLAERTKLAVGAWEYAHENFGFFYDNHRLTGDGEPYGGPSRYHRETVAFLNGADFLSAMRRLTGMEAIALADAQATLYRPGDYLTAHDDHVEGKNRLAAYVLNMTPGWRPDWGGALQFLDAKMHVEGGYVPAFNALNVFRVPKEHLVGQVALHGGSRYAITGWLRSL